MTVAEAVGLVKVDEYFRFSPPVPTFYFAFKGGSREILSVRENPTREVYKFVFKLTMKD